MYPKLFEIPGLGWPINSYGFMIMVGFLLATYIGVRRGKEIGVKSDLILDIGIISMIFGIVGAKINYLFQYSSPDELRIFDFSDGGLHPLGALALGWIPFAFWYWRTRRGPQIKLLSWQNGVLLVLTLLFAIVGTRALHLFLNRADPYYHWDVFKQWQSGFVLYGGLITAVLMGILYTKMRGESIAGIADLSAPLIMLGLAFGRVGCFLNGCCYGKIWHGFCAVSFPPGSPAFGEQANAGHIARNAASSAPVIPTQLMETAATLLLFFALSWYDRKKKKNRGETILLMGMGYAVWRFIVEFMRDDPRPSWLGTLTYSQTLSLGVFIVCGIWYFLTRTRPAQPETPALASEAAVKQTDAKL